MIDLKRITKGQEKREPRVLIYAQSAVGKTKFAVGAPDPLVIDADKGSHKFDARRIVPSSWDDFTEILSAVERGEIPCKTLVLDSVTELEAMSHAKLFGASGIDKHDGGYGKGDNVALLTWRSDALAPLERIWMQGKAVVLVAHAVVKSFNDPSLPAAYDRYEIAARPKLAGLLKATMDYVLFARIETAVGLSGDAKKPRHITTGIRTIRTRTCPAYDAKARGTLLFPESLPLSWEDFSRAIDNDSAVRDGMAAEIESMLKEIGDDTYAAQVRDYVKKYPTQIVESHNRVSAKLEEKKSKEQDNG